jgi:hypothetical protein
MTEAATESDELEHPGPDEQSETPAAEPKVPPEEALATAAAFWQETLRDIERSVNEATQAIHFLRGTLRELAPLLRGIGDLEEALNSLTAPGPQQPRSQSEAAPYSGGRPMPDRGDAVPSRSQAPPRSEEAAPPVPRAPRGLDLLPRSYTITVEDRREEDRRTNVDLAPLHRALMAIEGVRDLSLVSYTHGVAVISLEAQSEITTSELESAIAEAMQRDCTVVARDDYRMHVRVAD